MTAPTDWAEKYRPQTLADVIGNKSAVEFLWKWACEWEQGTPEKKAVILYGPPGVGKTSAALALASQIGWETIEMNASDQRTASALERVAGSASQMATLTGEYRRLIILDEADNMHGSSDRGGTRAMADIIKKTDQPIVLIANDLYGISPSIRTFCEEVKFNSLQQRSIILALKKICKEEKIMCGTGVLEKIASMAGGDLRSALRDLQAVATGKTEIHPEDIATAERDTKDSIFKVLSKIFNENDPVAAHKATFDLDETPEDLIQWVDENLPMQYLDKGQTMNEDVANAYRNLSHADRYLGRVRLRQNYGLWKYASFLLSGGVAVSKKHPHSGFRKLQPPSLWRRMGQVRAKRDMRDNIAAKISGHCHEPMRDSRGYSMRLYSRIVENDEGAVDVATILKLDADEIAYLKGKKVGKRIQKIYEESLKRLGEKEAEDIDAFIQEKKEVNQSIRSLESFAADPDPEPAPKVEKMTQKKPQKTLFDF
ncbi:replication factor C large subunit [Methanohalophilus sp.]|uniref:replication factor C large subunit n=1 Tax=Methanohalophilus sp. TaxID=1966352 RepID=UPI002637B9E3|nr:replication factor C large subunit [Methanohalophilus sp.]MDK2892005.1 replication factor large subunit [Methanohalophilus sp.]